MNRTSLAANAQYIQTPYMWHHPTKHPSIEEKEPRGPLATGEHYLYRWYKTKYVGLKNNVEEEMGPTEMEFGNVFIACPKLNGKSIQRASRNGCS